MREPIKLDESFGTGRFDWIDKVARGALIVTGVVTAGVIVAFAVDSEQGFWNLSIFSQNTASFIGADIQNFDDSSNL